MSNITDRTATVIATEINTIKHHAQTIMLTSAIEIGRRLVEAKEVVPHGEWGQWLEEQVDYSKSTANNLMRIAQEYGDKQLSMFGGKDLQALGNLSYTQAVALLGVPDYEREEFVRDNDVENMSTRELQRAIKERNEALEKLKATEKALDAAETDLEAVKDQLDSARQTKSDLEQKLSQTSMDLTQATTDGNLAEVQRLQKELEQAGKELSAAKTKVGELEAQLKDKPVDVPEVIERIPEEVEKELEELRKRANQPQDAIKFRVQFEALTNSFRELLEVLAKVKEQDAEVHKKFHGATVKLIDQMLGHL